MRAEPRRTRGARGRRRDRGRLRAASLREDHGPETAGAARPPRRRRPPTRPRPPRSRERPSWSAAAKARVEPKQRRRRARSVHKKVRCVRVRMHRRGLTIARAFCARAIPSKSSASSSTRRVARPGGFALVYAGPPKRTSVMSRCSQAIAGPGARGADGRGPHAQPCKIHGQM